MPVIQTAVKITHKYTEWSYGGNRSINVVIQAEDIPSGVTWRDLTVIKQNNEWPKGLFSLLKSLLTALKKGSKIMDGLQINNALLCDRDLPPQRRRPQRWEERHVTRTLRTLQHRCARNHPASYQARNPLHFKKSTGSSSDTLSVSEDSHSQPHLHAQPFRHHLQTPVAPACWPCASPPIYH